METEDNATVSSEKGDSHAAGATEGTNERAIRFMSVSGYLMLAVAASMLAYLALSPMFFGREITPPLPDGGSVIAWLMQHYANLVFGFIGALALLGVGIRLLGAAGKTTQTVIPAEDRNLLEPLVKEANKDAISQYVILSSLSGFTGTFQKIGFSGLPLATVSLTVFFCGLSFLKPEFIEFAKLTLGAFIGSFVQRGTDASKLPSITWEK